MKVNLVLLKKDGRQKSFPVESKKAVIGRHDDCDLRIPLTTVSRKHCQIDYKKGKVQVRDLGSRNGTFLNGKSTKEATVNAGDIMKLGPLSFVFQIDGKPEKIEVEVEDALGTPPSQAQTKLTKKKRIPKDDLFEGFSETDDSKASGESFDELPDDLSSILDEMNSPKEQ